MSAQGQLWCHCASVRLVTQAEGALLSLDQSSASRSGCFAGLAWGSCFGDGQQPCVRTRMCVHLINRGEAELELVTWPLGFTIQGVTWPLGFPIQGGSVFCVVLCADFGLAVKMDCMETHVSAFQGTMSHMSPGKGEACRPGPLRCPLPAHSTMKTGSGSWWSSSHAASYGHSDRQAQRLKLHIRSSKLTVARRFCCLPAPRHQYTAFDCSAAFSPSGRLSSQPSMPPCSLIALKIAVPDLSGRPFSSHTVWIVARRSVIAALPTCFSRISSGHFECI